MRRGEMGTEIEQLDRNRNCLNGLDPGSVIVLMRNIYTGMHRLALTFIPEFVAIVREHVFPHLHHQFTVSCSIFT